MTKKDYELLAKALGESLNKENMLEHICKVLKNGNPKFDQEKFIACMREAALTDD